MQKYIHISVHLHTYVRIQVLKDKKEIEDQVVDQVQDLEDQLNPQSDHFAQDPDAKYHEPKASYDHSHIYVAFYILLWMINNMQYLYSYIHSHTPQ